MADKRYSFYFILQKFNPFSYSFIIYKHIFSHFLYFFSLGHDGSFRACYTPCFCLLWHSACFLSALPPFSCVPGHNGLFFLAIPSFFLALGHSSLFALAMPPFFLAPGHGACFLSILPPFSHTSGHDGLLFACHTPFSYAPGHSPHASPAIPNHSKYPLTFNTFSSVPTACSARSNRIVIAPTSSVLYTIVSTSCKRSNVSSCGCP